MSMDTQDLLDRIAHGMTDQDDAEAVRGIIEERDRLDEAICRIARLALTDDPKKEPNP